MPPLSNTSAVPASLPNSWALVKSGYALYRSRLASFLALGVLSFIVTMFIDLVTTGSKQGWFTTLEGAAVAVGFLIVSIISVYVSLAIMLLAAGEQGVGAAAALRTAATRFLSYLWLSILIGVMVGGWTLLFVGVPAAILAFIAWKFIASIFAVLVLGVAGIAALIIVVVRSIWFSMSPWVFVVDGVKGMDALKQSRAMVEERSGPVFARFVGIGVLMFLVLIPALIVAFLVGMVLPPLGQLGLTQVVQGALSAFFTMPVTVAATYVFFKSLRA